MHVISFANPKGGSGKTTSAMLLAEQIAEAGARVTVLDCDPNKNIVQWAQMRTEAGKALPFAVQSITDEGALLDAVETAEASADYLIIDLEGTASQIVTYAVSRSDLVLIPFEPTPMEARQAARAVQLMIQTGKLMKREIPHALLFTRANAAFRTSDEKDVRKETEGRDVPVISEVIVKRAAYTRIFRDGMLLRELREEAAELSKNKTASAQERVLKPLDGAIANARRFAQEVSNRLQEQEQEAAA